MATNLVQAVKEDEQRKSRPNSFGDAAAVARNPGMTQAVPTATTPLGQMHNPSPRTGAQTLAPGMAVMAGRGGVMRPPRAWRRWNCAA